MDDGRKPTIFERIQMDLQHDLWNSRIKYWSGLAAMWGLSIVLWTGIIS